MSKRKTSLPRFRFFSWVSGPTMNLIFTMWDIFILLALVGIVAASVIMFGPYLINLPELLGHLMAWLCVSHGSCDLTTNMVSLAFSVVVTVGVLMVCILPLTKAADRAEPFEEVKTLIEYSGYEGITPAKIADLSDIGRMDTDRILAALFDDGLIDCTKNTAGQLVYTWKAKKKNERTLHKLDHDSRGT